MAEAVGTTGGRTSRGGPVVCEGTVVSDARAKTIKVVRRYLVKHRKYGKYIRRSTTLHAHDEHNDAKVGDVVELVACRRLSKTKSWRLGRVISGGDRAAR